MVHLTFLSPGRLTCGTKKALYLVSGRIRNLPYLETVGLLRGGGSVPLDQVVVRTVEVLVKLDDQGLEERGELTLALGRVNLKS